MKRMTLVALSFAILACPLLQAQNRMTADIPFRFELGQKAMPAGHYDIYYKGPYLLIFQCQAARESAAILTFPEEIKKAPETAKLGFHRYGNNYFFAGIWQAGSKAGLASWMTRREKELAAQAAAGPVTIAAKTAR